MTEDKRKELVERLRNKRIRGRPGFYNPDELCNEAAAQIERLSAALAKARAMADRWSSAAQDFGERLAASEAKVAELQAVLKVAAHFKITDSDGCEDAPEEALREIRKVTRAALASTAPAEGTP